MTTTSVLIVARVEARFATTCGGAIRMIDKATGKHLKTTEVFSDMMVGPTGSRASAVLDIQSDVLRVQYRACLPVKLGVHEKWVPPEDDVGKSTTVALSLPQLEPTRLPRKNERSVPALKPLRALRLGADEKDVAATGLILETSEKSRQIEIVGWRGVESSRMPVRWTDRVPWDPDWQPLFIDEGSFLIFDAVASLCRYDFKTGRREWCHTIDPLGDQRAGPDLDVDLYRLSEGYLAVTSGAGIFLLNPENGLAYWHHPFGTVDAVPAVLITGGALILGPLQNR